MTTTSKGLFLTAAFLAAAATAPAQSMVRVSSGIPAWADSALARVHFTAHYALTSGLNPDVRWADLDGDGFLDLALGIVAVGSRARGIAIVHRVDRSVHIIGAGQPVGGQPFDMTAFTDWAVARVSWHRVAVRVQGSRLAGWIVWSGTTYAWVQDSD